jgi:hypothetical protein
MKYVPYVYLLKNKTTGKKYVGVRWAKDCHPSEFWVEYFTSSKVVHSLIKIFGKDDFNFKIVHTFETAEKAILKEAKYVKLAVNKEDYLNMRHSPISNSEKCSQAGKIGGMLQVMRKQGIHKQTREERLEILKIARQEQNRRKKNPFSHASREKQSERGRRGGPKNKGFVWLTDGTANIKYTKKMQEKKSIEIFLLENPQIRRGRK